VARNLAHEQVSDEDFLMVTHLARLLIPDGQMTVKSGSRPTMLRCSSATSPSYRCGVVSKLFKNAQAQIALNRLHHITSQSSDK
jgi:hypothetical protein